MRTIHNAVLFLSIGLTFLPSFHAPALAQGKPGFEVLKGRWVRPDGGYVIHIQDVDSGGRIQAAYYNPNPIHVSRAEAALAGSVITVFVELRGPGYPGSAYNLVHDPKSDQLKGVYHHAVLKQDFTVVFVREK